MKKTIILISSVLIVTIGIMVIYFSIPKVDDSSLVINMKNISVKLDEKIKVDCSTSQKDAVISMEMKDNKIAKIINQSNENYVTGCSVGSTTLIVKAKYGNLKCEKEVVVKVRENSKLPEDNTGDITDPDNKNPDESETDNPKEDENSTSEKLAIDFTNLMRCTIDDKDIFVLKDKMAIFTINANINIENLSFKFTSDKISIKFLNEIGNNTYGLTSNESGKFSFKITINNETLNYYIIVQ